MILTPENIRTAIMTLWGPGKLKEAAKSVPCSYREMKRWAAGDTVPQLRYAGRLRRAIETRAAQMIEAIKPFAD